jgi:L-ascorbate metabolism protein UlaG (beta-lactamase superfamily)
MGAPADHCSPVEPGDVKTLVAAKVHVLRAEHPGLLGCDSPPFPGEVARVPDQPPGRPSDFVCGQPLAFIIEMGGKRIYIDSGGTPDSLPAKQAGPVDLAMIGVALKCSRQRFVDAAARLRPTWIIPTHQDDFFRPLADGFYFGRGSDFGAVRRAYEAQQPPGRMILLDYFRPWTLK